MHNCVDIGRNHVDDATETTISLVDLMTGLEMVDSSQVFLWFLNVEKILAEAQQSSPR
jgi:hypothetical protein